MQVWWGSQPLNRTLVLYNKVNKGLEFAVCDCDGLLKFFLDRAFLLLLVFRRLRSWFDQTTDSLVPTSLSEMGSYPLSSFLVPTPCKSLSFDFDDTRRNSFIGTDCFRNWV